MVERFWGCVARWLSRHQRVVDWLMERAMRTPYEHLDGYMLRWWLVESPPRWSPLDRRARIHEILREDQGDPHNHPWSFRTLILRGWYIEQREGQPGILRRAGTTARLKHDEFHKITMVAKGTVTLCIIGPKVASWGFRTPAGFVPWREYCAADPTPWEQGAGS